MSQLGEQALRMDLVGNLAHVQEDAVKYYNTLLEGQTVWKTASARTLPRNTSAGGNVLQRGKIKRIPELS